MALFLVVQYFLSSDSVISTLKDANVKDSVVM